MISPKTTETVQHRRAISRNRETVQAYERCARDYARATAPQMSSSGGQTLQRFAQALEPGSSILEIGSGPGWDADFLEARGMQVRRTDICDSFLALQRERGKAAERLDIITDALGGPYDSIVALYVFQHLDPSLMGDVLEKVAQALRPGGVLLVSLREGVGQERQMSESSGIFYSALWPLADFKNQLQAAGLHPQWVEFSEDEEGDWMIFLARAPT